MSNFIKFLLNYLIIITVFFALGFGFGLFWRYSDNKIFFDSRLSKDGIVQKIKKINQLEVLEFLVERNMDVELDLGAAQFLGLKLDKKRSQNIDVSGIVVAGIDLSQLDSNDVQLNNDQISLNLPKARILYTKVNEQNTSVNEDSLSFLYRIESITDQRRLELNEILRKQIATQAEQALTQTACESQILTKAEEEAKKQVQRLFTFTNARINVTIEQSTTCP